MIRTVLRGPIFFYRWFIRPVLGNHCRFYPSCSQYALEAIDKHGAGKGSWLALRRILRCHPWHAGGVDLVPELNQAELTQPGLIQAELTQPGIKQDTC